MSAESFRALFNNPAFVSWYTAEKKTPNLDSSSFLSIGRQDSKNFVKRSVGDFILSREQLTDIFGADVTSKLIQASKTDLNSFDLVNYRQVSGQEQLIFPGIKFSTVNKEVEKILRNLDSGVTSNVISNKINAYFEKNPQDIGHIFGFTNTLLSRAKIEARKSVLAKAERQLKSANNIGSAPGIKEAELFLENSKEQLDALDSFIDSMIEVLEEYDISTSPIKGLDMDINSKYRKTALAWAFTWESSAQQQATGSKLATILGNINQSKIGGKGVRGLFASLQLNPSEEIVTKILGDFVQEFIDKSIASPNSPSLNLLKQQSSPSMLELIEDSIKAALGKPRRFKEVYTGSVKLKPIPILKVTKKDSSKSLAELKGLKTKVKKTVASVKSEVQRVKAIRNTQGRFTSLASLQTLLNLALAKQIQQNMGTGTSKNILNYRTGRFAESAQVTSLSQSRENMITAFYTYQRNPYGTFSEGGAQGSPRTRDPKLLISKSIREILATQVNNRMRAVLA